MTESTTAKPKRTRQISADMMLKSIEKINAQIGVLELARDTYVNKLEEFRKKINEAIE